MLREVVQYAGAGGFLRPDGQRYLYEKMKSIRECYKILGISPTDDKVQIKSAFRQKALSVHPDVHDVSSVSNLDFIFLRNAYETIMVYVSRPSSKNSERSSGTRRPERGSQSDASEKKFAQQLNWLVWDIEDLFRNQRKARNTVYSGETVYRDILMTLVLLDKDILMKAGLRDNFMTARKLPSLDPEDYREVLFSGVSISRHFPYTSVENYFFDIRMRMNDLLERVDRRTLRLWELWNSQQALEKTMNTFQNCVYNVSRIGECLREDKPFRNDFVKVKELTSAEGNGNKRSAL